MHRRGYTSSHLYLTQTSPSTSSLQGRTGAADSPAPGRTEVYAVPGESPVRQNLFGASLTGKLSFGDNTSLGLDADADFLHTGSHLSPRYPYLSYGDYSAKDGSTVGLIALTPISTTRRPRSKPASARRWMSASTTAASST